MRGRNKSTRAVAMANHHCFALTAQIRNRKTFETILELANVTFFSHSFRTTQISMVPWECQNESGVCDDELQPSCRLNSLNVMRHTGTCSVHFEGDPGRTKLETVSSIFALPQYLQRKPPKSRRAKAAQLKEVNETPHRRRRTRCLPPGNKP